MGRFALALLLLIYVAVALLNYSVTQSLLGSWASDRLSEQSGGVVRVGSMGVNVFNHVKLRDVMLVTPEGDTVANVGRLTVRFKEFPYKGNRLRLDRVRVSDGYYCCAYDSVGMNLHYLLDLFPSKESAGGRFFVEVDQLTLARVEFRMDNNKSRGKLHYEHGVDIPHMDYCDIRAKFRNIRVDGDHVTCRVERLAAREWSGLVVEDLKMNVFVSQRGISVTDMELRTPMTNLSMDVLLDYDGWEMMGDYIDSVYMFVRFKPGSVASMADAAFWAPVLWGMDERVGLEGVVYGPVADLHVEGMEVAFGQDSRLSFDGYIYGLPCMDTTVIGVDVHRLQTNYADLAAVRHPGEQRMHAAEVVRKLGDIELSASFIGTIKDFYATLDMESALGPLKTDLVLQYDPQVKRYSYMTEASSRGFSLAALLPNDWVSRSGFSLNAQGEGFDVRSMSATADVQLFNTSLRGCRLSPSALAVEAEEGLVSLDFSIADSSLALDVDGQLDLRDSLNAYQLSLDLDRADLCRLRLAEEGDSVRVLSSRVQLQAFGNDVESLFGSVNVDDCCLLRNADSLLLHSAVARIRTYDNFKNISLNCDPLRLSVKGFFDYADLPLMVRKFRGDFLPGFFAAPQPLSDADLANLADADLEFSLNLDGDQELLHKLLPQLALAHGTAVQGNYNFAESLKLAMRSDSVEMGSVRLNDVMLNSRSLGGAYRASLTAAALQMGETSLLQQVKVLAMSTPERLNCGVLWDDGAEQPSSGKVSLTALSRQDSLICVVGDNEFFVHGDPWHLQMEEPALLTHRSLCIADCRLQSQEQMIALSMNFKHELSDFLQLDFDRFDLQRVAFLLQPMGFDIEGMLDGRFSLFGWEDVPYFTSNLTVADWVVNGQPMGDAEISSSWNAENDRISLFLSTDLERESGRSHPLEVGGYVDIAPELDTAQLDFDVAFDDFSLQTVAPLVKDFSSELEGSLGGDFTLEGSLNSPTVDGVAFIENGRMKIDFLNTVYSFSDSISFTNDEIALRHFALHDVYGNAAFVDGVVRHRDFRDFRLDLQLSTDKFLFLNTSAQDQPYYGSVLASAQGVVTGPLDDVSLQVNARTRPGSALTIPINNKLQAKDLDFISFVSDDFEEEQVTKPSGRSGTSNRFDLTINLAVTPDVRLAIPMDFSQMYVNIGATGAGDLQLRISSESDFSIRGDYELSDGSMNLSLLSLLNRNFTIDEGSTIKFAGAIPDAEFDIRAIYSQRVNLSSLMGSSSSELSQSNVQVENVIALSGSLQNPSLNFDLRLPNADQSLQDEVFAFIDQSDEREMLNQTVSLLLLGQFYSASTANASSSSGLLDNGISSGYSVLANSVGNVLSNMVQVVDVNFGYKAETDYTTELYEVDINKEWNKFYLESSFGIGGESRDMASVENNNLVGDMLVGYKLSPRLHIFAFNRSNTNDYTRADLPYKQGFGLKYTRDFDKWRELLKGKSSHAPAKKK